MEHPLPSTHYSLSGGFRMSRRSTFNDTQNPATGMIYPAGRTTGFCRIARPSNHKRHPSILNHVPQDHHPSSLNSVTLNSRVPDNNEAGAFSTGFPTTLDGLSYTSTLQHVRVFLRNQVRADYGIRRSRCARPARAPL
ncbi:uncharacterized protein TRAVEDRAFT_32474, partial [Trametes versicolor FP-101664 SS1]